MHSEHDKKRLQGRHGMVAEALRETAQDPFVRDSSRYGIFWGGDARFGGGTSKAREATTNGGGSVRRWASAVFAFDWQRLRGEKEAP